MAMRIDKANDDGAGASRAVAPRELMLLSISKS
jgi:hypothetical protein